VKYFRPSAEFRRIDLAAGPIDQFAFRRLLPTDGESRRVGTEGAELMEHVAGAFGLTRNSVLTTRSAKTTPVEVPYRKPSFPGPATPYVIRFTGGREVAHERELARGEILKTLPEIVVP
jgi:hypothetical protein